MDLSGLIFVALAVAWAAYLIPKALRHHDDVERGRSIDRFSQGMRVLARREPISAGKARLVETSARPARAVPEGGAPAPTLDEQYAARRAATRRATRRRRRVLAALLLAIAGVVAAAVDGRLGYVYVAIPAGLLVAWLIACRLMVRKERSWRPVELTGVESPTAQADASPATPEPGAEASGADDASARDPQLWDPVPVTLPTYVSKPPARRAVRTIDLDATGVWTSGRTEFDSALAREADAAEAAERVRRRVARSGDEGEAAVGS